MSILEAKTGIVLFDPNKIKMGISASEIIKAYNESDIIKELVERGSWYGTIQNPIDQFNINTFLTIDHMSVAFKINRIWKIKEKIFGDIDILDTPAGTHLQKVFNMMVFVPRALGHKEKNECLLVTFDVRPDVMRAQVDPDVNEN